MMRSLQAHHRAVLPQRQGNAVNCSGDTKSMKIDRFCVCKNATYGDYFIA